MDTYANFIQYLFEQTQRPSYVEVGHGGVGGNVYWDKGKSTISYINTSDAIGNEPGKSGKYFSRARVKHKMSRLTRAAKSGKLDTPVISTPHPADPSKHIVLDGNHRLQAHRVANSARIPSHVLSHDDVHLIGSNNRTYSLSNFRSPNGSYDMDKQHPELGGLSLNHYFAHPKLHDK